VFPADILGQLIPALLDTASGFPPGKASQQVWIVRPGPVEDPLQEDGLSVVPVFTRILNPAFAIESGGGLVYPFRPEVQPLTARFTRFSISGILKWL